jgi:transcriptional regulator with XRE-family HTH domain
MSHKESFGLRLRAARERQGISLDAIAERTKVSIALWQALERNDFSRWPVGLFARAYVRDYAAIVGLHADEVVDEFCRYFPNGDRRRGNLVRAQAEVIDVRSQYSEDQVPPEGDRRAPSSAAPSGTRRLLADQRRRRVLGAAADVTAVTAAALMASQATGGSFLAALGIISLAYHSVGSLVAGRSPGVALADLLARRVPELVPAVGRRMHA